MRDLRRNILTLGYYFKAPDYGNGEKGRRKYSIS